MTDWRISMAKNTNRAASAIAYVAALGLAFGASAAHWELTTDNDVVFAAEALGDGTAELTLGVDDAMTTDVDEATRVNLLLVAPDGVGVNSEVTITFTLTGAVFGNTVQINDFDSNDDDLDVVNGTKEGGRAGTDNTVSVRFKAGSDLQAAGPSTADDENRPMISLDITAIEEAAGLVTPKSKVTVGAEVELYGTTNSANTAADFPIGTATPPGERDDDTTADVMEHLDDDGNFKFKAADNAIASSALGVEYAATAGADGQIMIDDRTKLVGGSISLGSFDSTPNNAALDADGNVFATTTGSDANINITVEGGNVGEGDTIYFNTDGKAGAGAKETLSVTGSVASGSFRLNHATLPTAVHYMPSGDNEMGRGDFTTTFQVVYDSADVKDPVAAMATVNLEYSGVDMKARAYAIPNPENMDTGNVRIKCEVGGMLTCTTFIECDQQEGGDPLFGEVGEIAAGATMHLQAGDIAALVGEDSWSGRLSCDVLSDRDVSVQVLVRSDQSLVNNTYVDDMSAMTALADAVSSVMAVVRGVDTAVGAVGGKVDTAISAACDQVANRGGLETDNTCYVAP
jgi:hypothetical protein